MEKRESLTFIDLTNSPKSKETLIGLIYKILATDIGFVTTTTLLVLLLTGLPYLYGYLSTPVGKHFMGLMLDVPDHAQYFAWMRDLTHANLVSNRMTGEFNRPVFFNLLWWLMGRTGKLLNLGYAGMYQLLRFTATPLFLGLVYLVCGWFLKERNQRRIAFLIITFTSGFGWILVALKYLTRGEILFPLDLFIAEGNSFLGVLGYPHFIAAATYIVIFYLVLYGQTRNQIRYAFYAGLLGLFLGWQHTYDLVSVYGVLVAYALLLTLRYRQLPIYVIKSGLIIGILSCSPAIYSLWLTNSDPVWKRILAQFVNAGVFTPNLLHLVILFGPTFLLAIFTVVKKNPINLNTKSDNELFLLGWFLVTFLLIYLPVEYQIHLLNGWQVPMAILATIGLFEYVNPWLQRIALSFVTKISGSENRFSLSRYLPLAFILLIIPTNIYLLSWRFFDLSRHTYPYYLSSDEMAGMDWINKNARPDDVVLASLTTGEYIPVLTGSHAYLAHWAQTLDYFNKTMAVNHFFSDQASPSQQDTILKQGKVKYVFFGPAEHTSPAISLDGNPELKKVFTSGNVFIYEYEQAQQ